MLAAGAPNIIGQFSRAVNLNFVPSMNLYNGAFHSIELGDNSTGSTTTGNYLSGIDFDASRCSSVYGRSTTVQPPALVLLPQIRY